MTTTARVTAPAPRLILCYSRTGNNRMLAGAIGARLNAPVVEVRTRRPDWAVFVALDLVLKRRPAIRPLEIDAARVGHLLLMAPLYDRQVAHPMQSAVAALAPGLGRYSFATLCGYRRAGQAEAVRAQLEALAGHPPEHVWQLYVGDLVPSPDRQKVRVVSARRLAPGDLAAFAPEVNAIVTALRQP